MSSRVAGIDVGRRCFRAPTCFFTWPLEALLAWRERVCEAPLRALWQLAQRSLHGHGHFGSWTGRTQRESERRGLFVAAHASMRHSKSTWG